MNYRESVERVYRYLLQAGISCEMFHGGMEQKDRERALYKFSNGSCNVFVSTDLAARGLDIPNIDHVIHYHCRSMKMLIFIVTVERRGGMLPEMSFSY